MTGSVGLRLLTIMGWAYFPGERAGPQIARVLIPLLFSAALIVFNQRMLARDRFPSQALGLAPTPARAAGFLAGFVVMPLLLIAFASALWLAVPFHYERGPLTVTGLSLRSLEYLGGNTWVGKKGQVEYLAASFCPAPRSANLTVFSALSLPRTLR